MKMFSVCEKLIIYGVSSEAVLQQSIAKNLLVFRFKVRDEVLYYICVIPEKST